MLHRELLINGVFLGGPCDTSVGKEVSRSPWTGHVVGTWAEAGPAEIEAALDAAATAFPLWSLSSAEERRELLLRIASLIRDRREELANLMVQEIGKPITAALAEIDRTQITFELFAGLTDCGYAPVDISHDPRSSNYSLEVQREARGPVLAITPYNWPFNLAAHKIGPALACGCTVVLKGSEKAGLCTLELARLIHEAGCPAGVVNAIQCPTPLAARMVSDPRIKVVSFTGSAAVGWHIRSQVPDKHVVLELGGTAPCIVTPSADLRVAAQRIALSGNVYAGQVCISAQNVYAHSSVIGEFSSLLAEELALLPCGDPSLPETVVGPVIDPAAAERIREAIGVALPPGQEGVPRLAGGRAVDTESQATTSLPLVSLGDSPLKKGGELSPSPREGGVAPRSGDGGGNTGVPPSPTASGLPPLGGEHLPQLQEQAAEGAAHPNLIRPTLLIGGGPTDEIFGPVLTLRPYESLPDVIQEINGSPWGIHAAIFTQEESEVTQAKQIECSALVVNDGPSVRFDAMPYGGVKRSGLGREGGIFALDDYSLPKSTIKRSN